MKTINDLESIQAAISNHDMVLFYFTTTDCNLCKDLFPKIELMLEDFPKVFGFRAEVDQTLSLVGQFSVFTVPTIVLFVQGKETIRRSRQIGITEFSEALSRYYDMLFDEEMS